MKVGLCGFTMSAREYFETFPVVEVQQTFYEPPALRTILRWREQAPAGFEFTMKAWQLITHRSTSNTYRRLRTPLTDRERDECGAFQPTEVVFRGWETTLRCAEVLHATAILFQCPASFRPLPENLENMRKFFARVTPPPGVRFLWEPRGAWPDDVIVGICRELNLTHVVDPFLRPALTLELTYWRLHGIGSHYRPYTDEELKDLASRITDAETYVMFNEVPRVVDAQRFLRIAGR
jgi:uncharacterized protein YecE (DUF72 family)